MKKELEGEGNIRKCRHNIYNERIDGDILFYVPNINNNKDQETKYVHIVYLQTLVGQVLEEKTS